MNNRDHIQKIIFIAFFLFLFLFFLRPIDSDGDFFQHVNIGRSVVTNTALPHFDDFTFTARGKPFIGYAWGTGVIFYLLYANLGPVSINMFVSLIAVVTFILLYLWLKTYSLSRSVIFILLLCVAGVVSTRWLTRPEIITYPFLVSFFLIDRVKDKHSKIVFLYPFLTLVWANMYGNSVFVGLFFLFIFGIKQFLNDKKIAANQKLFYCCILLSIPLSLLNGYGFDSILFITLIPRMAHIFGDWASLMDVVTRTSVDVLLVYQYRVLLFLLYLIAFLIVVLLSLKRLRRYLFEIFLALFLFLPFGAFRQYPLAILLSVPLFALLIQEMKSKRKIILGIIFFLGIYSLCISNWLNGIGIGENTQTFPPQLIQFIQQHNLKRRVFNTQQIGAFLTYHLYPNSRVFSDTRDELFLDNSPILEVENTLSRNLGITPLLKKYNVDYGVINLAEGGLSYRTLFYSKTWAPVYMDERYVVIIPRQKAIKEHIQILDAIDPFSPTGAKKNQQQKALSQYMQTNNKILTTVSLLSIGELDKAIQTASEIHIQNGPSSVLQEITKDYLFAEVYRLKRDCVHANEYYNLIQTNTKGKLLFYPQQTLLSPINHTSSLSCK